jgi:hypothetical protein
METFLDSIRCFRLRNGQCYCIGAAVNRNDYSISVFAHATLLTSNRHPGSYVQEECSSRCIGNSLQERRKIESAAVTATKG